jgi:hypothetical protein
MFGLRAWLVTVMLSTELQPIVDNVLRRAQRQGFVLSREIREEMAQAGLPEDQWKVVVALARPALGLRQGKYYYIPALSARIRHEQRQQTNILRAIRKLSRHHREATSQMERREQGRLDFIQPVTVRTEDNRELRLLSRDLSASGIRLIGTRGFLGQKLHVTIPDSGGEPICFLVRILWTCEVGDNLFENGGRFLTLGKE